MHLWAVLCFSYYLCRQDYAKDIFVFMLLCPAVLHLYGFSTSGGASQRLGHRW